MNALTTPAASSTIVLSNLRMPRQNLTSRESPRSSGRQRLPALIASAPLIATVVLGLAIAAQVADIAVTLVGDAAFGATARSVTTGGRMGTRGSAMQLAALSISRAHLFGRAPIAATATSRVVSRAPLVLTGIIATGDPKEGFAILGTSAATAHVSHAGSEAAPGVVLAEVYPQWVILLRGGERVTLMLPRGAGGQPVNVRFAQTAAPPEEVADSGEDGAARPSPGDFKPPPMSDASTILRAFSLRPVSIGGERGVRIMGTGINSNTLSALGLAPGDVIMQIDGVPIGSKNTPDLGKVLSGGGGVTLIVSRGGGETSVTIDPSAAANAAEAYRQAAPDL